MLDFIKKKMLKNFKLIKYFLLRFKEIDLVMKYQKREKMEKAISFYIRNLSKE